MVIFMVWFFYRRIPGLRYWYLSYFFGCFVALGLIFRPLFPEWVTVLTVQVGLFLMAYCTFLGCNAYVGAAAIAPRYGVAGAMVVVSSALYFTLIDYNLVLRVLVGSFSAGVLYLLSAKTIAQGSATLFPVRYMLASGCVVHGLFLVSRPLWLIQNGLEPIAAGGGHNYLPPWALLESVLAPMLLAFGILMLVNEYIAGELRHLAEKDPLTDIFNRRAFLRLLDQAINMAQRRNVGLPVLLVDLDHFKQVNDTWGHQCGDDVLKHFVAVASSCLREDDVFGRMGGEEFSLFLPLTDLDGAVAIAERLRAAVAARPLSLGEDIPLTVSIGVTICQPHEPPDAALQRADQAMYHAKEQGRNRVNIL